MKIVIIGGGIGGYATGLFLHRLGADITIYEARDRPSTLIGGGVGLATNGIGILAGYSTALAKRIHETGYPAATHEMRTSDGDILGNSPAGRAGRYGEFGSVLCARWDVHKVLLDELESVGIPVEYGKEAESLLDGDDEVVVKFKGGMEVKADLVVGADGTHSITRATLLGPDIKPIYEGRIGVCGFIPRSSLPPIIDEWFPTPGTGKGAVMTFGQLGFFVVAPADRKTAAEGGQIMWWSTFDAPEQPRGGWQNIPHEEVKRNLEERHGNWFSPIPEVIAAATNSLCLGNYDLAGLRTWHGKRIVLLGDAAHVMQPHSGQGISCALEDAAYLAFVLKPFLALNGSDVPLNDIGRALEAYEAERKPRVEEIIKIARIIGDQMKEKSAFGFFIMRWVMKVLLKFFMFEGLRDSEFTWRFPKGLFDTEVKG